MMREFKGGPAPLIGKMPWLGRPVEKPARIVTLANDTRHGTQKPTGESSGVVLPRQPGERTGKSSGVVLPRQPRENDAAEPAPDSGKSWAEIKAFVKGTVAAFIKYAVKLAADAHGLGWLLRAGEWVMKAAEWAQVVEGERQVDVDVPIPVGAGELNFSARVGRSANDDEPLITVCFGPATGPDPGVLVVDGCQIRPGEAMSEDGLAGENAEATSHTHERETETASVPSAEDGSRVIQVEVDLSELVSRQKDPLTRVAALMRGVRDELVPALKQQQRWDDLAAAGVKRVVYYDQKNRESVWLFFSDTEKRHMSSSIALDSAGRFIP
jgi:hypothetical protein